MIPDTTIKMTPEADLYPPILHSNDYEEPVPLPGTVNTAGAEDSPFIPRDINEFYFFFTPDVTVPVEKQLLDGATGIYMAQMINGIYTDEKRILLHNRDKLSLDGCTFIKGNTMWFCSAREGYTGLHWFTAEFVDGEWANPVNIEIVNSESNEGIPYITPDGKKLWFNRLYFGTPAVFRSKRVNGQWQELELIISQFAGEPTLDSNGNIYFVHHFYIDNEIIEADIYVAYRK